MAKRKRLNPADPTKIPAIEMKSAFTGNGDSWDGARAPIAQVAGDAAASAALAELTDQMAEARAQGRMIIDLPLKAIDASYLIRDRLVVDTEEMQSLVESIKARGQQTPIEVADLGEGRYGLISGWRRLEALKQLATEGDARSVQALLRCPDDAAEAYLAMVEENEIRVGLSYYERAAIAVKAVDQGVFETEKAALLHIYHAASRAKRSKIRSFLKIVQVLDGALVFPSTISERVGLALAKEIDARPELIKELKASLLRVPPETADHEARRIEAALTVRPKAALIKPKEQKSDGTTPALLSRDIKVEAREDGSLILSGPGLTTGLRAKLLTWLGKQ